MHSMSRPKNEEKLHAIHRAALKLLVRSGFSSVKMADIAKEAGVASGTLYIYYSSKEHLLNALFVLTKQEIAQHMFRMFDPKEDYLSSFRNMWFAYMQYCIDFPEKMLFVEQFLYSGLITAENIEQTELFFEPLNTFLDTGRKKKYLLNIDAALLKASMAGSIHEFVKWMHSQHIKPNNSLLENLFRLQWKGISQ